MKTTHRRTLWGAALAIIIGIVATAAALRLSAAALGALQHTPWAARRYGGVVMPLLWVFVILFNCLVKLGQHTSAAPTD